MTTKTLPRSAFEFLAPAGISAADDAVGNAERILTGVAYSGGIVTDHGYWDSLVIDLASLTVDTPIPLLCNHDRECTVGMVTTAMTQAGNLGIKARLFADVDDEAQEIAAKADKGFPWQLSVGIWPNSIENVPAGNDISINGLSLKGPLTIFRGGRVREVSVVAIGADSKTSATVLNAGDQFEIPIITHEETAMSKELEAKVAALEAENAQLKANAVELSAKNDPSKFVPMDILNATQAELSALRESESSRKIDDLIKPALSDGRLLAAQEQWARDLGKTHLSALESFLGTAQPNPALLGTQTGGKPPVAASAANFKAASGYEVDPGMAALHAEVSAYAKQHNVDYLTAALAVGA